MARAILWVALPMLKIMGCLVCGFWLGHVMLGL